MPTGVQTATTGRRWEAQLGWAGERRVPRAHRAAPWCKAPRFPTTSTQVAGLRRFAGHNTHRSGRTHVKLSKLILSAVVVSAVALSSAVTYAADKGLIGVLMPTKTSQRWINDGDAVKLQLEALGYTVDLQYAQDDIANQLSQLENEITKGPKALIIASIDGTTM